MDPSPNRARQRVAAVALLALSLGACRAIQSVAEAPGKVTKSLLPGQQAPDKTPISELHPELLRFADFTAQRLRAASDDFALADGTPEGRIQGVEWRVGISRTVLQSATGPVPLMGFLDLLVGITAAELIIEDHMIPNVWGESARPMLEALEAAETRAWSILGEFFTSEQIAGLEATLAAWKASKQGQASDLGEDLPTFQQVTASLGQEEESESGGFLGLVSLDPLAGLEPMAREVALTRQFAERLLFWSERLPMLIDDQVELATLRTQRLPEVVQVLADVERVSKAVDTVAQTAAELPDKVSVEREAALRQAADEIAVLRDSTLEQVSAELTAQRDATLRQVSDEITAQREGIMHDLETAQEPLESLLGESRSTIESARSMTAELNALVAAVDTLLVRFETPEGAEEPEPGPPGRPFDITEYGDTITRLGEAASELRELVATLDASLPQVEQMVDVAATRGDETIDHAFRRGLQLGLALVAAMAVAAVLVRLVSSRLARKSS